MRSALPPPLVDRVSDPPAAVADVGIDPLGDDFDAAPPPLVVDDDELELLLVPFVAFWVL